VVVVSLLESSPSASYGWSNAVSAAVPMMGGLVLTIGPRRQSLGVYCELVRLAFHRVFADLILFIFPESSSNL
jgi:hypothetical protein